MKLCPVCNSQIPDNQEIPELVPLGYHEDTLALSIKRRIAAEEKLRWIPVSERLPENTIFYAKDVIVYCKSGYIASVSPLTCLRWIDEEDFVTHWMPLPEPPQEVE